MYNKSFTTEEFMKNKKTAATMAAIVAQVIFGFAFMFTKIALDYASPMSVIADRYTLAFLGLTIAVIFTKTKIKFTKNIWKLVLMSFFQPVLYFICECYGIKLTTSAFSSVMISLVPVVAMVSGIVVLKEIPSPMQYLFTILSVCGVAIYTYTGSADGTVTPVGVMLLVGAVLAAVAYNTASRKISAEFTALERTYAMAIVGLLVFGMISLFESGGEVKNIIIRFQTPPYIISIIYLGIVSSVGAFLLLNYANTYLPVAKTTVFSNLTTVISVFAGMMFLNEKISWIGVTSVIMIIIGVCGVQMFEVKKKI